MNIEKDPVITIESYDGVTSTTSIFPTSLLNVLQDKLFAFALIDALEKELSEQARKLIA
jgi:hypothetical protein